MNVRPVAVAVRLLSPATYDHYRPVCKDSPMRCVIAYRDLPDAYVDGYFHSMSYDPCLDSLEIRYICDRLPPYILDGVPGMDSECFVTYRGKKYTDMRKLYMTYTADRESAAIDRALGDL